MLRSFDNAIDDDDENDNIVHHRVSTTTEAISSHLRRIDPDHRNPRMASVMKSCEVSMVRTERSNLVYYIVQYILYLTQLLSALSSCISLCIGLY